MFYYQLNIKLINFLKPNLDFIWMLLIYKSEFIAKYLKYLKIEFNFFQKFIIFNITILSIEVKL